MTSGRQFLRLLRYVRPYLSILLLAVALMALSGAAHGMIALLAGPIFDRVLDPSTPDVPVKLFRLPLTGQPVYLQSLVPSALHNIWTIVAFLILVVFLVKGAGDYLGNYLVNYTGISVVTDLRQAVYDKVLRQDPEFFESNSTGSVMSALMNDIDRIQVATSSMLADWLRQSFSAIALVYVVLQKDWKLALVTLTVLPFVLVPTVRLGRRIRRTTRTAQDYAAELHEILQETISGHRIVAAFGGEEQESRRFRAAARRLRSASLRYVLQQAAASPLIEFFGALTIVGLLTYAREQIKAGQMTTGEFTSFVIALLMLYEPVKRLTGIHAIFQQAAGASERVFEYLDRPNRIQDMPGAVPLKGLRESIVFDRVTFRYPKGDRPAVTDISLEVRRGEVVALVGHSGAGKSTLVNLLVRFYDPDSGRILIDGRDLRQYQLASLRSQIAMVAQEVFLFNDTAANNIRYGRPEASLEEIKQAARMAFADGFIEALPQGYDTVIGERGARLSGGQRQRIAIARALLRNAPILILDEATSHLDAESEILVQSALANLMQGRTVIVIAHRLSTIRRADKIVVLEQGRIREIGTHQDLINHGGIYHRLHELQYLEPEGAARP